MTPDTNYPEKFKSFFEKEDYCLDANLEDAGTACMFRFVLSGDCITQLPWNMWVNNEGYVKIVTYPAFGAERSVRLLDTLNDLNSQSSFAKFFIDSENDLGIEYDFLLSGSDEEMPRTASRLLFLMNDIANDSIPQILKAVYAAEEPCFSDDDDASASDFRTLLERALRQADNEMNQG